MYSKIPVPNTTYDIAHSLDPHTILTYFKDIFDNLDSTVRIDQQVGQKLTVFYRYLHDTFPEVLPQGQFTTVYIAGANTTTVVNPGTQHLAHGTYVFNPTLLLNVGYAFSNGNIVSTPSGFLASAQSPDIKIDAQLPYANTVGLIPTTAVNGMTSLNGSVAYIDHGTNHQIFGDITKTLHTHTLIAGFSYNHYQKLENNTTGTQGSFGFNNDTGVAIVPTNNNGGANEAQAFANFLIGNASNGFSQLSRDPVTDMKDALYEGFVQDNWKATPRLTLNLGVRYAFYGQPWDANGLLSNFDPAQYYAAAAPTIATNGLICFTGTCSQAGSNAGLSTSPNPNADYSGINYINGMIFNGPRAANNNQSSPYGNKVGTAQKANLAPRFGFAIDVFGDGKTSLRGGYGWAFDDAEVSYYETTVFNNPPAVATYSVSQTSFDSPTGGALTTLSTTPGRIQAVPINYKTPYVQQFSLDLQQQFSPTFMVDVGYFGDHGTHLLGADEIDQPKPGAWMGVVTPEPLPAPRCLLNGHSRDAQLHLRSRAEPDQALSWLLRDRRAADHLQFKLQLPASEGDQAILRQDLHRRQLHMVARPHQRPGGLLGIYPEHLQRQRRLRPRFCRPQTSCSTSTAFSKSPCSAIRRDLKAGCWADGSSPASTAVNSGLPLTVAASGGLQINYNLPGGVSSVFNNATNGGTMTDNAGLSVLGNYQRRPAARTRSEIPNQAGNRDQNP